MSSEYIGNKKYYVTMTDKFMSGWGGARGKINKYIVGCDTMDEVDRIIRNAEKRSEMKYINWTSSKPYYNTKRYRISYVTYASLGAIWKK